MSDESNVAAAGCFFGILLIIGAILFGPFLTLWVINTLMITPIAGAEKNLPYVLFSVQWWAALLGGGILTAPFAAFRKKD